jgi:hypothetical protein
MFRFYLFCFAFLTFAHRALCAAAIFARAFADILRRLRIGLAVPRYTPAKAASAAFNPVNCRSTRVSLRLQLFHNPRQVRHSMPPKRGSLAH